MVAEHSIPLTSTGYGCSLAKISMVAEHDEETSIRFYSCSLAKISMVAELNILGN